MGSSTSAPPQSTAVNAAVAPKDNFMWIMTSLKAVLPYLEFESVLCLHSVNKLLVWHVHNLGAWRALCLRDFPNARTQFHERVILRAPRPANKRALPDDDAKALYLELFCQRFVLEAEVRLHSHCIGSMPQQLNELIRHGNTPIPITFKASIGRVPTTFPLFPPLKPSETSSLVLEWIPRPGVALTNENMDLLQRAITFLAHQLVSDPKDGPIQPGSGTKGRRPRVVLSRGMTAEGAPVLVSSFNFENGSEAWKRTRKGRRGAFQQVWKLFKRCVSHRKRGKLKPNNYQHAARGLLARSRFMFPLLSFLRQTRHMRRRAQKYSHSKKQQTKMGAASRTRHAKASGCRPLELKLHLTEKMLNNEVRLFGGIYVAGLFVCV